MEKIELKVNTRKVTGKKVRFLRNQGVVPVHLFGHNIDSLALQGETVNLQKVLSQAGRTRLIELKVGEDQKVRNVMVREVQKDPIKGHLIHVDFYEVNMAERIRVEVPITLTGESPALKLRENMLSQDLNTLLIECLPDRMPDKIQVDISSLQEADDAVRVKDVILPDINVLNDPDLVIAKVSTRQVEVVEGAGPAAAEGAAGAGEGETKTEAKTGAAKPEAKAGTAKTGAAKPEAKAGTAKTEAKGEKEKK